MDSHSYNSGRIRRADEVRAAGADVGVAAKKKTKKKKRNPWVVAVSVLLVVVLGGGAGAWAFYHYVSNDLLDPGAFGVANSENATPAEWDGLVLNMLILGIDYEDGRYAQEGVGLTDMIMFVHLDLVQKSMYMLQVPRDAYIARQSQSVNGRINALLLNGPDKENPINNIFTVFREDFNLPVDRYIAMDMQALKAIVDHIGPLYVYVPFDMEYKGSRLEQGWQWLNGEQAEFFVRYRQGINVMRGDVDRLDIQRHFYSALFRRFLNLSPRDIQKLMPVFDLYCNTNFTVSELVSVAMSIYSIKAENIMMCKVPGATGGADKEAWPGAVTGDPEHFVIDLYGRGTEEDPGLAWLLNTYFRHHDTNAPVSADQLGLPKIDIPGDITLYSPGIRFMDEVQEEEGGTDVDVEPDA